MPAPRVTRLFLVASSRALLLLLVERAASSMIANTNCTDIPTVGHTSYSTLLTDELPDTDLSIYVQNNRPILSLFYYSVGYMAQSNKRIDFFQGRRKLCTARRYA